MSKYTVPPNQSNFTDHTNQSRYNTTQTSNDDTETNNTNTDTSSASICDSNDAIMIYWMTVCDKQQKQQILDINSDELYSELAFNVDNIDISYQKHVVNLLADSDTLTTIRYQFVRAIHNGGEYVIDDVISACKKPYDKHIVQSCIDIFSNHLYINYKQNLLFRKLLMAVAFYCFCISYSHWLIRYSIIVLCACIDNIPPSNTIYTTIHNYISILYNDLSIQFDTSGISFHKYTSSAKYRRLSLDRSDHRLHTLISMWYILTLNTWFDIAWKQYCLAASLIALLCVEYEMYNCIDIKTNTQRITRSIAAITLLITEILATYLLWYTKRTAIFALIYFFPWLTSFAVSSAFLLLALLLPLFGVIQLKLIDYDKRPKLVWCLLIFAVYTLFRWGTSYYHTLCSIAGVFISIPPTAVQYLSLSFTAIGAIVLNIGIVEAICAVIKLLCVLTLTAVALAISQISPTIAQQFATKNVFNNSSR